MDSEAESWDQTQGSAVAVEPGTPFDSIEGALEYVSLLAEAVKEARAAIEDDIALAHGEGSARRLEALLLVNHKLDRLAHHVGSARFILNDLRTLRRLLLGGRRGAWQVVGSAG